MKHLIYMYRGLINLSRMLLIIAGIMGIAIFSIWSIGTYPFIFVPLYILIFIYIVGWADV